MPVTIQHAKSDTLADFTGTVTVDDNSGNGTSTIAASNLVLPSDWNSVHNVTFTPSAAEIASLFGVEHRITQTTNTNGITFGLDNDLGFFEPVPLAGATQNLAYGNGTWYVDPVQNPGALNSGVIQQGFWLSSGQSGPFGYPASTVSTGSTGDEQKFATFYNRMALYLRGTGTNSSRLESQWSGENSVQMSWDLTVTSQATGTIGMTEQVWISYPYLWNSTGGQSYTSRSGSGSFSTTVSSAALSKVSTIAAISNIQAYFTGGIMIPIEFDYRMSAGEWWIAHQISSTSSRTSTAGYSIGTILPAISKLGVSEVPNTSWHMINQSISASTSNIMPGHGFWSGTTSASAPVTMALTDIKVNATNPRVYWNYQKFLS